MQAFSSGRNSTWSILLRRWNGPTLVVLALLVAALGLRFYGYDWDGGHFFHPDERSILMRAACMHDVLRAAPGWEQCVDRAFPLPTPGIPSIGTSFDKDASPLNPHWFPIGSITIYLLVAVRAVLMLFMDSVSLQDLAAVGRVLMAFMDTGSVLLLYLLGRRMYGAVAGLLAAAFYAFAPMYLQLAHFYRPEPFVVLLGLASFWWMLNVLEHGRTRDHVGLGVVFGLSLAVRASSLPLLFPIALTYGVLLWRRWQQESAGQGQAVVYLGDETGAPAQATERPVSLAWMTDIWKTALLTAVAAFVAFAVIQPYALLDYRQYLGDLAWEASKTAGSVPYTVQYVGIPQNGVFEVRQSVVWGLGMPLGILAWAALALTVVRAFRRPRLTDWLLLALVMPSLLIVLSYEVKFLRYLVMVLPLMMLMGGSWVAAAYERARVRSVVLGRAVTGVAVFIVVATAFFGTAFVTAYGREHPAVQASAWMNANAQPGSFILTDNHWDEGFPDLWTFDVRQLPMYEPDNPDKVQRISELLAEADYIMAYSNRPWGSIARLPGRYPYSSAYYHALFSGELGYELVQAFDRYPTLAGISFVHDPFTMATVPRPELPGVETRVAFNLGYADENVTNYDRPLVLVWRNTERLSQDRVAGIMLQGEIAPAAEPAMLSAEDLARQQQRGTWTAIFSERGLNGAAPWLAWLLLVELIFIAALPLAVRIFRWLPDRGVVLARPLGLLLVAWLVWIGASTGLWEFSRASVFLAIALVALASNLLLFREWRFLLAHLRRHWRYVVSMEALFIVGFLVFVLIRAANPDLWHPWRGGEKPMDLAYLTAVVKSVSFPPYDPWYAGGFVNYYYFGWVIVGVLVKATGIVPEVAYNLAVPLLFALTLAGAFAVGYNLAESFRRRRPDLHWRSTVAAGVASMLLVSVLANVDGLAQLIQGTARVIGGEQFGMFDFWRSSRLMPGQIAINEFPFWSFLFADLHPHMISLPFQVLVLGLLTNLVLSARTPFVPSTGSGQALREPQVLRVPQDERERIGGRDGLRFMVRRVPALAATAWVVGSLAAINTWDVPVYGLLALTALGVVVLARYGGDPARAGVRWLLWAAAFWAVLYLSWLPFHQHYDAPTGGFRTSEWRTVLWHYLAIHALLFVVVGGWLVYEFRGRFLAPRLSPGPGAAPVREPEARSFTGTGRRYRLPLMVGLPLFLLVWFLVPALREWTTALMLSVFLFMAATLALRWLLRSGRPEAGPLVLLYAMAAGALGIGIGVDFITLGNDIDRMNTVFKFNLNAWVLFGIVGGVGLWRLWAAGALSGRGGWSWLRGAWLGFLALLMVASAVFPVLGTRARIADRFDTNIPLTLNGMAYMQTAVYHDPGPQGGPSGAYELRHDAEALAFLRQYVQGTPVFMEGVTTQYRWTPRVAKYTGLPVVIGYEWHQIQQRGADGGHANVIRRVQDVQAAYSTTDEARLWDVVRRYGVEYIYVGPVERLYFPAEGIAKFERLAGRGLEIFYGNDEVTVYRVTSPR